MCWVEGKDLYQKNEKDIIGQYISRKVLRGYLISEEQEVVDIMMAFCRGCYRRQVFGCLVWVSCFRWEFPSDTGCSRCGFPLLFACFGRRLFFVFGLGRMRCFKADALFWVILVHLARTAWCTGIPIGGMGFVQDGMAFRGDFQYTQPGLSCAAWSWEIYGKGLVFWKSVHICVLEKPGKYIRDI